MRVCGIVVLAAWLCTLVWLTERRLPDWKDEVSIWQAAVHVDPTSATGHGSLGEALLVQGQGPQAEGHFWADISQRPDRLVSRIMLALALEQRGAHGDASREWRIVEKMAAQRFGPGRNPVVTTRGDRVMGLIIPPEVHPEHIFFKAGGEGAR